MEKYKIKLIPSERTLFVFIGEYNKTQMDNFANEHLEIDPRWRGCYATAYVNGNLEPLIWIENPKCLDTILHETVHCVTDLMKTLTINDDEFRAHYTQWLYSEISRKAGVKANGKRML